jgi:hypothetical protein
MLERGGNHLLVPSCPHPVEGSIPIIPPDTSNDHESAYSHLEIT